ncbi:hypothetical protein HAX54_037202 [Datura stramonium]|uniref:Uncharacterized protein n=1 Tax=Datura stramonium TaxID=4076 RepID=A0ABS8VLA2_DATST|nr:hypothetical protein [Datura stramonium]
MKIRYIDIILTDKKLRNIDLGDLSEADLPESSEQREPVDKKLYDDLKCELAEVRNDMIVLRKKVNDQHNDIKAYMDRQFKLILDEIRLSRMKRTAHLNDEEDDFSNTAKVYAGIPTKFNVEADIQCGVDVGYTYSEVAEHEINGQYAQETTVSKNSSVPSSFDTTTGCLSKSVEKGVSSTKIPTLNDFELPLFNESRIGYYEKRIAIDRNKAPAYAESDAADPLACVLQEDIQKHASDSKLTLDVLRQSQQLTGNTPIL